jgi:hypothetical protein
MSKAWPKLLITLFGLLIAMLFFYPIGPRSPGIRQNITARASGRKKSAG